MTGTLSSLSNFFHHVMYPRVERFQKEVRGVSRRIPGATAGSWFLVLKHLPADRREDSHVPQLKCKKKKRKRKSNSCGEDVKRKKLFHERL